MLTFDSLYATLPMLLILLGAVFVHACFQLSVSVLTLLSSHTIGRRLPHHRLLSLSFWYVLGVITAITGLLLVAIAFERTLAATDARVAAILTLSILPVVALLTVLFYYRRGKGTQLWLPRPAAEYITTRAKKTRSSVESFALGMTTVVVELPFAIAPLAIAAFTLHGFASQKWLGLSLLYAVVVALPLIFVGLYLAGGHKVSAVQRWREESKDFLKWASAAALVLLTLYLAVLQMGVTS